MCSNAKRRPRTVEPDRSDKSRAMWAGARARRRARETSAFIVLVACVMVCSCARPLRWPGACDAHRRGATLVTRHIIVYGARMVQEGTTTYYTCLRPAGVPVKLGMDELGGVYGSDATTGGFRAAGTYVTAQSSTGAATAAVSARYNPVRKCSRVRYWIRLVEAKAGRRADVPIYAKLRIPALAWFPMTVALSADGAVAWLQPSIRDTNTTSGLQLWATVGLFRQTVGGGRRRYDSPTPSSPTAARDSARRQTGRTRAGERRATQSFRAPDRLRLRRSSAHGLRRRTA